jgi:hypothetical protein
LVGFAVKVTLSPEHIFCLSADTFTTGVRIGIAVIAFDGVLMELKQDNVLYNKQLTVMSLVKLKV